jgi:hypothetical protein
MNAAIMRARCLTTRTSLLIGLLLTMVLAYQPSTAEPGAASPVSGRWSAPLLMASGAYAPVMVAASESTILVYNQATVGSSGNTNPSYRMLPVNGSGWSEAASIHSDPGKQFRQATARFDSNQTAHAVWRGSTTVFYATQNQWLTNQFAVVLADENKMIEDLDMAIGNDNVVHIAVTLQDETGINPYNITHVYFDGQSWITTELVDDTARRLVAVKAAVDTDNNVHVVWEERTSLVPGIYQIYYAQGSKLADGYSWTAAEPISGGINRARRPAILAIGNELHVTFTQYVADDQQTIYYTRRPSGSSSWTAPSDITGNSPLAVNLAPRVMASSLTWCQDSLYVFYFGGLEANSNEQIFGQRYQYGVWQSREMITDNSVRRIRHTAVCHNNRLQLAYEQIVTPGTNHAIYVVAAYEQVHLPLILKN